MSDSTPDEGQVLVATQTFVTIHDGERVFVRKGKTRIRAGHPITVNNPQRFKVADVAFDVIETTREQPPAPPAPAKKAASPAPAKKAAAPSASADKE